MDDPDVEEGLVEFDELEKEDEDVDDGEDNDEGKGLNWIAVVNNVLSFKWSHKELRQKSQHVAQLNNWIE